MFVLSVVLLLTACVKASPKKDKLVNDFMAEGMSVSDARAAYNKQYQTDILVYVPDVGIQKDDSRWITQDNLIEVSKMASCPPSTNQFSINKTAVIKDDGVHLIVNRLDCQIDKVAVKEYLDKAINSNQIQHRKRLDDERAMKELSALGPFVIGCQDYQRQFKGQEIYSMSSAIEKYHKMDSTYVINLYKMGFDTAQYYGPNSDCYYLAATRGVFE